MPRESPQAPFAAAVTAFTLRESRTGSARCAPGPRSRPAPRPAGWRDRVLSSCAGQCRVEHQRASDGAMRRLLRLVRAHCSSGLGGARGPQQAPAARRARAGLPRLGAHGGARAASQAASRCGAFAGQAAHAAARAAAVRKRAAQLLARWPSEDERARLSRLAEGEHDLKGRIGGADGAAGRLSRAPGRRPRLFLQPQAARAAVKAAYRCGASHGAGQGAPSMPPRAQSASR